MADAEIKVKISKDGSSDLDKSLRDSESLVGKLTSAVEGKLGAAAGDTFGGIAKLLTGPFALALGGVGLAATALKKDFDFTLQAERIEQISRSFDNLAESAGLSGKSLSEGLTSAARGLADNDDILEAANRAIVQLGANASVIPQSMELARKATALFGGDLIQNFESLNDAFASGNARALRQFGIIVNNDKAIRDFAKSQGVAVDVLSDAAKKQAVMNAALDIANKKFANVDENTTQATQAYQRMKVSFKELGDEIAITLRNSGFFKTVLEGIGDAASFAGARLKANFGQGIEAATQKFGEAETKIKTLESAILRLTRAQGTGFGQAGDNEYLKKLRSDLELAKIEAEDARKSMARLTALKDAPATDKKKSAGGVGDAGGEGLFDPKAVAALNQQIAQSILSVRQTKLAADQAMIQSSQNYGDKSAQIESLFAEKRSLIIDEYNQKELTLHQLKIDRKAGDDAQYAIQAAAIEAERLAKFKASFDEERQAKREAQAKSLSDQLANIDYDPAASFANVVDSFRIQGEQIKNIATQTASALRSSLAGGFSDAFSSMGKAFATGKNGLQEFGKSVLNTIGSLCIQLGQFFMLVGVGMTATGSLLGLSGGGAIAAGIGLTVLGGLLQGLAGGGSDSAGASAGGGGGDSAASGSAALPNVPDQKQGAQIVVNIQGNVFDKRSTGLAIAEVLRESFASNATVLAS